MQKNYPLVCAKNMGAYAVIMGLWLLISLAAALGIRSASQGNLGWGEALIWSLASVMAGMGIMFGASAMNLKKLRSGFARLASGESDPAIPRVWCPVLTMATRATLELQQSMHHAKKESSDE